MLFRHFICSIILLFGVAVSAVYAEKPVLVLFPVQVGAADADFEGEFGTALQEGLQRRYKVYYGPAVEAELEKEYEKIDCDAEQCQQNVAIAFNGELVADASAKRLGDGYVLKLVISNIVTNEIVESQIHPCEGCNGFEVLRQFKVIGIGSVAAGASETAISFKSNKEVNSLTSSSTTALNTNPAIFIFDSQPSGAEVTINGKLVGKTPYQGLKHQLGETLEVSLHKSNFKPVEFTAKLDKELVRLNQPFIMEAVSQGASSSFSRHNKVLLQTNYGEIIIELDVEKAPNTAANFVQYVVEGFYDGLIFHRVIDDFMVQGGGFTQDMVLKRARASIQNEADNGLKNGPGTIALARTSDPHSGNSQFFINVIDNTYLNHVSKDSRGWGYCVFGKVISGMDVVNKIADVKTSKKYGHSDVPITPVIIMKASVLAG